MHQHTAESLDTHACALLGIASPAEDPSAHARLLGDLVKAAQIGAFPVSKRRNDRVFSAIDTDAEIAGPDCDAMPRAVAKWWAATGHDHLPGGLLMCVGQPWWKAVVDEAQQARLEAALAEKDARIFELEEQVEKLANGGLALDDMPLLKIAIAVAADLHPGAGERWQHSSAGVEAIIYEANPDLPASDVKCIRAVITPPYARVGGRPSKNPSALKNRVRRGS